MNGSRIAMRTAMRAQHARFVLRAQAIDRNTTRGMGEARRTRCLAELRRCMDLLARGVTAQELIDAQATLAVAPRARQGVLPMR